MKKTPPVMHLVLPVTCSDEHCDDRPQVAQIAVTALDAKDLLRDVRQARRLKRGRWASLCNVEVFDYSPQWAESIDADQLPRPVHDLLRDTDFQGPDDFEDLVILVAQPLPLIVGECSCATDCDRRSIYDDRIHWAAYLKHTNTEVTTESIRLEELKQVAQAFRSLARARKG